MTEETGQAGSAPEGDSAAGGDNAGQVAPWYQGEGFTDELNGYVQNKGWETPASVVESYRNLEKLHGVPADRLLKLPGDDSTDEDWMPIYDRLGRPEGPDGYELPAGDSVDEAFQTWAKDTFHKLGLPKGMGERLAQEYEEFAQTAAQGFIEDRKNATEAEKVALKREWGAAMEQNTGKARQAAQALGLDGGTFAALEESMGFAKVMKLFHNIGERMGESAFHGADSATGFGQVMTPEVAKAKIAELMQDRGFVSKYNAGDHKAREEMGRLHEWAYPDN